MKKLPAFILFIFTLISSLFIFPKFVSAAVLFQDDFESGNADQWTVIRGNWSVQSIMGSKRYGSRIVPQFTIAETQAGDFTWTDYQFEVEMTAMAGEDRNLFFRSTEGRSIYDDGGGHIFNWPQGYGLHMSYGGIRLYKFLSNGFIGLASNSLPFSSGTTHRFKIIVIANNIKVYADDNLLIDYTDIDNPILQGRIALAVGTGAAAPTEVWFDNVLVTSLEPSPTPTPTPTPTLQPLILLPGLGGSWNHEEIFLGSDQPQSAWYETPFKDDYDGLLQTLQNAGYTLNQDLFVFYYDWLKPIDQSANDLKSFIESKVNPPPGTKIDLVGHSLGGLVARTYIQRNSGTHQVDQLITLGSPHKGAPQVYRAWEGADLNSLLGDKERIGAGILLRLRGFGYPNLVQAVRNLVPSLDNLLFIDNYLKWNIGGMIKPESSMNQQNTWLKNLGTSPELLGLSSTVVGTNINTPRWIKIVERGKIDELLGRWEDGKPVDEKFASGDEIVLEESAKLAGANIAPLNGINHGDLVKSRVGQEKILELLGIPAGAIVEQPEIPFEPALVFTVASPATLRVTDPSGRRVGAGIDPPEIPNATFSAQEKIIIIPEALDGEYKIEVISENNGGPYRLLIGQLTQKQDIWSTYQDTVGSGKTNTYTIPIDNALATTDSYLANLINLKLKNLLREILRQEINPHVKTRSTTKVLKILGQTEPLPMLLKLERHKLADRYTQRAILNTTTAIDYSEKFNQDLLPPLREILDLLGELHQLLES